MCRGLKAPWKGSFLSQSTVSNFIEDGKAKASYIMTDKIFSNGRKELSSVSPEQDGFVSETIEIND